VIIAPMNRRVIVAFIGLTWCVGALAGQPDTTAAAREHAARGLQYAQAGDLVDAEAELRRAVELAPNDASYLTSLGGILGMQQKLDLANVYFERAVKSDPDDTTARRNLAANQWRLGLFKQAQVNLEWLLRAQPQDKTAMLLLGMVSENEHDYARATKLLAAVPELVEQRPESVAALASSYYHTGRREEAHAVLEALLGRPAAPEGIFAAAGVAAKAEDYGIAEKLFQSIRSSYPDTARLEYNVALIQFRTQRIEECQKTLVELINTGRANADSYNLLVTMFTNTNRLAAALDLARKGVQAFPQSESLYRCKGMVEMKMDQFTDALQSYSRAVALNPKSVDAKVGLASAKWAAGLRTEAKVDFQSLLKEHPREASVYEAYGTSLLNSANDDTTLGRAAVLLNEAIELDGSQAEAHYQLGVLELKKSTSAISPAGLRQVLEHLEAATRLGLNDSRIHYALARVYRRLGRDSEADKEMSLYDQLKQAEEGSKGRAESKSAAR
jgi:tetratricopeptide (TPR) repeat protein